MRKQDKNSGKKEIRKIQEMLVKENDECQGCLRFQRHQLFPSKS